MQRVVVGASARFAEGKLQKVPLFESPHFFCDLYCLLPGQAQTVHQHAEADKVYFALQGTAVVRVGEAEAELAPGEAVLAPAGIAHGVTNRSVGPATLLVFMAPRPAHAAAPGRPG